MPKPTFMPAAARVPTRPMRATIAARVRSIVQSHHRRVLRSRLEESRAANETRRALGLD